VSGGHGVAEVRLGRRGPAGGRPAATLGDLPLVGVTQQCGYLGEGGGVLNMLRQALSASGLRYEGGDAALDASRHEPPPWWSCPDGQTARIVWMPAQSRDWLCAA
jgi:hypothetical protein